MKTHLNNEENKEEFKRREFLTFMGSLATATLFPMGCSSILRNPNSSSNVIDINSQLPFLPLAPSLADDLVTIKGLKYSILVSEHQLLNKNGLKFGVNNDYLAIFSTNNPNRFLLTSNHEGFYPLLNFKNENNSREKKWIDEEMKSVGVGITEIEKYTNSNSGSVEYKIIYDSPFNKRIDANAMIPIISERPVMNSKLARGTFANCAGGVTPWGTVLSCEENYADFVGERKKGESKITPVTGNDFGWYKTHGDMPPEHYGWVVEIDPKSGNAKKHTALGRMAHEGATVTKAKDGRIVVYMGDDANDRCLYKFISNSSDNIEKGTLYVADLKKKEWVALDLQSQKKLKEVYDDQTEVLIYAREAAELLDGTPLDRPEDIEIDPVTNDVFISLTNNYPKGRPHGSILKIKEFNQDAGSQQFEYSTFVLGGELAGISSPDNLVIDKNGNLWMTTDISGAKIGKGEFAYHGNNSLYFIPLRGEGVGRPIRVAAAPREAELTGPCFSPDGNQLFLSVQHPGETSKSLKKLTSNWPNGGTEVPKSSVVVLSGPSMDYLLNWGK